MHDHASKSSIFLRCMVACLLAGVWVFFANLGAPPAWLTPNVCNLAIALTFVVVFAFPWGNRWPVRQGDAEAAFPERKHGLLPVATALGANVCGLALLFWLLLLRPDQSSRASGIPLENYKPANGTGVVLTIVVGLCLLGVATLSWRDWKKQAPCERTLQKMTMAVLFVSYLIWTFLLLALCIPAIFIDIINS
ncbi:MAG: hypothetical protein L6R28_12885 [Planctomycetes bacterium]|nr:hypothetical protein [Planctomycetota bacterium]